MLLLERCRDRLRGLSARHGLDGAAVTVLARPLTPEEAIGTPGRRDFPILEGRERVIEATVDGARGQAFTDSPSEFIGRFRDILDSPLATSRERAVFLAAMNAALCRLGIAEGTVHCRDDDPEECAAEIAAAARGAGARTVGLVGLNPAIAEALAGEFGPANLMISDMNPRNIGAVKFGVTVIDGREGAAAIARSCDLVLATGTALANGTLDGISCLARDAERRLVLYGVTAAGACALLGLERWCFRPREGR
ncbi:MAG: DUF364 domain-containing protein [bacterium]|nr:DUF364 domain-containing protein [bacterium]